VFSWLFGDSGKDEQVGGWNGEEVSEQAERVRAVHHHRRSPNKNRRARRLFCQCLRNQGSALELSFHVLILDQSSHFQRNKRKPGDFPLNVGMFDGLDKRDLAQLPLHL
jgi:predicted ATPase with chaperone activity